MTDVLLIETGNGGDVVLRGADLVKIFGYENALYLAMFGGYDWHGNAFIADDASKFDSKTEKALLDNQLTSAGRRNIEKAIQTDLVFLDNIPGTTYSLITTIVNSNRLDIVITINGELFSFSWNPDKLFLTYQIK